MKTAMPGADILIVGAGIIGMSLALELRRRGAEVLLLERAARRERTPGMASWAAAGMIAAEDPYHPAELRALSRQSASRYDDYLSQIAASGGDEVRYQTSQTRQYLNDGSSVELREHSVDPRQLFRALRAAVADYVREAVTVSEVSETHAGVVAAVGEHREQVHGAQIVWAHGAWAAPWMRPRKGQMMRVALREPLNIVHRAEHIYVVPRTVGGQAGTALIGATVEDAGFDAATYPADLEALREKAAELVPQVRDAEIVESWAGFRPASASGLPVMSRVPGTIRQFVCGGHFRNGILLAPGSAVVMADLLQDRAPSVDLAPFALGFAQAGR